MKWSDMMRAVKVCLILFFSLGAMVLPALAVQDFTASIDGHIQRLEARFGIPILYKDVVISSTDIQYKLVTPDEYKSLNDYLDLFEEELNKYPPGFFKKRDLKGLLLVERLFRGEIPADGMYNRDRQMMVFDVLRSGRNPSQQRHSIHHEIFHLMAQQFPVSELLKRADWAGLNGRGFFYGKVHKPLTEQNPVNRSAPNELGFVTYYAFQSEDEDQAEIFACLMQKQHKKLIEEWSKKDDILRRKIEIIKRFVAGYDEDMDEMYWKKLSE